MRIEKRKATVTILLAIFGILIEWFYVDYMLSRGLEDKTAGLVVVQGAFPLAVLPALGAFLVFLASWDYASRKVSPIRTRPEAKGREISWWLGVAKAASLVTATFVTALFLPYVLWSSWFWSFLGRISGLASLYQNTVDIWQMNVLWKYVASQNLSALLTAIVAVVYARRPPPIKKTK
jgi:hypothetical protein